MTGDDIIKASVCCKNKRCEKCPLNGVHLCDKIVNIYDGKNNDNSEYEKCEGSVIYDSPKE